MAVLGKDNKGNRNHINPFKRTAAANKGVNEMTKSLRDTIYNACVFNLNFIWEYTLNTLRHFGCLVTDISKIKKRIDEVVTNTAGMKSIVQIYQYMVQNPISGSYYLSIEQVKETMPHYARYFDDDTTVVDSEDKIDIIKENILKEKLNPNKTIIRQDGKIQ